MATDDVDIIRRITTQLFGSFHIGNSACTFDLSPSVCLDHFDEIVGFVNCVEQETHLSF